MNMKNKINKKQKNYDLPFFEVNINAATYGDKDFSYVITIDLGHCKILRRFNDFHSGDSASVVIEMVKYCVDSLLIELQLHGKIKGYELH